MFWIHTPWMIMAGLLLKLNYILDLRLGRRFKLANYQDSDSIFDSASSKEA